MILLALLQFLLDYFIMLPIRLFIIALDAL